MIKDIAIEKMKSASNYVITFLKWALISIIIGVVGGCVGALFHMSVNYANIIFTMHDWFVLFLPIGGIIIVAMYKACKMLENKGTDSIISSIRNDEKVPISLAPLIFVSTVITHLCGGSAGREGAALQLGGSIGSNIGRLFKLDEKDMHMVVMCGMSAVFSALFGTPITAAVFALGVTSVGIMYYSALVPCLMSSLAAFLVTRFAGLEPTQFAITVIPQTGVITILQTILISALCAELSIIFCTTMHYTARYLKIWFKNPYIRVVVGALAIIALTYLTGSRDYNGSGMDIIEHAVVGGHAKGWAWALKIVFTAITIGAGFKGGEIVPTLAVGSSFGCTFGLLTGFEPSLCAAAGMLATFVGVTNCPIATMFLGFELFGFEAMPYFAVAVAISFTLSGYYGLYSGQKFTYSKTKAEFINRKAH